MRSVFILWLGVILMSINLEGFSQGFVENALLFSRTKPGGSARIQALGGAQVSLGGDCSSALSNPAGLGMYNRSEFSFSPAINTYNIGAKHLGSSENTTSSVFNIPSIGYVRHTSMDKNGLLGGTFCASLTRTNDFNNRFAYHGTDNASSIVDYFEQWAQGYSINEVPSPYQDTPLLNFDFPEGLAYQTYIITPYNEEPGNSTPSLPDDYINYYSELDTLTDEIRTVDRNELVKTSGSQYQWSFAYGMNYMDKLFFGASVGITTLRYKFSRTYTESNYLFSTDPSYNPLDYMLLKEDITIDGSGANFTLGVIYRPIHIVQVGMSLVTPTYYNLSDSYKAKIQTQWNNRGFIEASSQEPIKSEYTLKTPLKFTTGGTLFLGKHGFITADAEFINYGNANYTSKVSGVSFPQENKDIKYYYKNTVNFRVGLELRQSIYRFRAGYASQTSPYKKTSIDRPINTVSTGLGIKLQRVSFDFALLVSNSKSTYSAYALKDNSGPVASLKNKITSGMLTVGYSF